MAGAMMVAAQAAKGLMDFRSKMMEARNIDDARTRLRHQMDLDMEALRNQEAAHVGQARVATAVSGFKEKGSKSKVINDAIYQFKLRGAQYMNTYRLQRKAMKIQANESRIGAWTGLIGAGTQVGAGIKGLMPQQQQSPISTPQLGSTYQQGGQLNARSIFNRKPNYGIRLR